MDPAEAPTQQQVRSTGSRGAFGPEFVVVHCSLACEISDNVFDPTALAAPREPLAGLGREFSRVYLVDIRDEFADSLSPVHGVERVGQRVKRNHQRGAAKFALGHQSQQ